MSGPIVDQDTPGRPDTNGEIHEPERTVGGPGLGDSGLMDFDGLDFDAFDLPACEPRRPEFMPCPAFVTPGFARYLMRRPDLAAVWASAPYRRALYHVCFRAGCDGYTEGGVLFGQGHVAGVLGLDYGYRGEAAPVGPFLDGLRDALPEGWLTRHEFSWRSDKSASRMTAVTFEPDDDFNAALRRERRDRLVYDRSVDLSTGRTVRPEDVAARRRKAVEEQAARAIEEAERKVRALGADEDGLAWRVALARHLNGRSATFFKNRVLANYQGVSALLFDPADPQAPANDPPRLKALSSLLHTVLHVWRPHYSIGVRTPRLVPVGEGIATAPSEWRPVLLPDCFEADMKAAQLALVASLWRVEVLHEWLRSGIDVWGALMDHLAEVFGRPAPTDPTERKRVKRALKTFVYGLAFGMGRDRLEQMGYGDDFSESQEEEWRRNVKAPLNAFGVDEVERVGRALLEHPVLAAVHEARERRKEEMKEAGGLTDVFGHRYRLWGWLDGERITPEFLLAAEMQAAEAFVMLPVGRVFIDHDEAEGQNDLTLALWQADGFSYHVRGESSAKAREYFAVLSEALQRGCGALVERTGCLPVITSLSLDHAPSWFDGELG